MNYFPITVEGRVCLDAGISTGGFSDCLLQFGASFIYGIDVGYGQLDWKLRTDKRLSLKERTNIRYLKSDDLYGPNDKWANLAVGDLSFISISLVIDSISSLLQKDSEIIFLVKPQFEVGRERVGKGGVVRDLDSHIFALNSVIDVTSKYGWSPKGLIASPLKGPAGNHEYLLWLDNLKGSNYLPNIERLVENTLS